MPKVFKQTVQDEVIRRYQEITPDTTTGMTDLDRLLAPLPVNPSLGKMIVFGTIFRFFDPVLILIASFRQLGLFGQRLESAQNHQEARRTFQADAQSSHADFTESIHRYRLNSTSSHATRSTTEKLENILVEADLTLMTPPNERLKPQLGQPSLNLDAAKLNLIEALTLAGQRPNIAAATDVSIYTTKFRTQFEKPATVGSDSIKCARAGNRIPLWQSKDENAGPHLPVGSLLTFARLGRLAHIQLLLNDTSVVTPLMATLMGGGLRMEDSHVQVDDWLTLAAHDEQTISTVVQFRHVLDAVLSRAFQELGRRDKALLADEPLRDKSVGAAAEMLAMKASESTDREGELFEGL